MPLSTSKALFPMAAGELANRKEMQALGENMKDFSSLIEIENKEENKKFLEVPLHVICRGPPLPDEKPLNLPPEEELEFEKQRGIQFQKDEEEYKQHLEIQRQILGRSKDSILHECDRGIGHNIHHPKDRGGDPDKVVGIISALIPKR